MIRKLKQYKYIWYTTIISTLLFAIIGFILTAGFIGIKLHLFNDPGGVDYNDRYFQKLDNEYQSLQSDTSKNDVFRIAKFYSKLNVLNEFYPLNAQLIHNAYLQHKNIALAERMIEAINLSMIDSNDYNNKIKECEILYGHTSTATQKPYNLFEWMNIPEWSDFKIAVLKDTTLIDSAAKVMDVEPRLILSVLLGEQMRLFNSSREMYKNVIRPLKILSVEAKFSLGVTGVKEETAILAEKYLKDSTSAFYAGKEYEHLLDFNTADIAKERYDRLVNYRNHYYSYLYAAVIMKEIRQQWKKAGYDISDRPEILATLYNVGYHYSVPKENPSVGGSNIMINDRYYTFGSLAYEFYYSGEMTEYFPYEPGIW